MTGWRTHCWRLWWTLEEPQLWCFSVGFIFIPGSRQLFSSQRLTVEQRSLLKWTLPVFVLISHLHCNHEACHYDPEPPRRINPPHLPPSSRPPASAFILHEASLINAEASVDHFPSKPSGPLTVPRYVQEYRKSPELLLSFPPPPVRSSARCFQRAGF